MDEYIAVRCAEPGDLQAVFDLAHECATSLAVERAAFEVAVKGLVASDAAACLVATTDDHVHGYCLVFEHVTFYHVCWVEEVAVRAKHRYTGLANGLITGTEAWARARGA